MKRILYKKLTKKHVVFIVTAPTNSAFGTGATRNKLENIANKKWKMNDIKFFIIIRFSALFFQFFHGFMFSRFGRMSLTKDKKSKSTQLGLEILSLIIPQCLSLFIKDFGEFFFHFLHEQKLQRSPSTTLFASVFLCSQRSLHLNDTCLPLQNIYRHF